MPGDHKEIAFTPACYKANRLKVCLHIPPAAAFNLTEDQDQEQARPGQEKGELKDLVVYMPGQAKAENAGGGGLPAHHYLAMQGTVGDGNPGD
jgi:hypothetical protein